MGFVKVDGVKRFEYALNVSDFNDALRIKQFIAVILFDVFGHTFLDRPAKLEIIRRIGAAGE